MSGCDNKLYYAVTYYHGKPTGHGTKAFPRNEMVCSCGGGGIVRLCPADDILLVDVVLPRYHEQIDITFRLLAAAAVRYWSHTKTARAFSQ